MAVVILDTDTGEFLNETEIVDYDPKDIAYLPPLDISKVRNAKQFNDTVSAHLGKRKFKLWVSSFLLDLVVERELNNMSLCVFCVLGRSIAVNNLVYTTSKQLVEDSGYCRQTINKSLDQLLEKGFIRYLPNKLDNKGDKLMMVSPLYFFSGYYPNRENALKDWFIVPQREY